MPDVPPLVDEAAKHDERIATRLTIAEFFLEITLAGYTGRVVAGRPVADTMGELIANTDYAQGLRVMMDRQGVNVNDLSVAERKTFELIMEMSILSIIYAHGKLPGSIQHSIADDITSL